MLLDVAGFRQSLHLRDGVVKHGSKKTESLKLRPDQRAVSLMSNGQEVPVVGPVPAKPDCTAPPGTASLQPSSPAMFRSSVETDRLPTDINTPPATFTVTSEALSRMSVGMRAIRTLRHLASNH